MIVTISVPRNKLSPIFRCGFLISPAMNVTLFHASLLKMEPTIALATAPRAAAPITGCQEIMVELLAVGCIDDFIMAHASVQFAFHISAFAAKKPNIIS